MARKGVTLWELSKQLRSTGDLVTTVRHYALREDGVIVGKDVITFKSDGRRHDYGWKRIFTKADVEQHGEHGADALKQRWISQGFTEVSK